MEQKLKKFKIINNLFFADLFLSDLTLLDL